MSLAEPIVPPLVAGEKLSREEFLRRWEALPQLKFAELIEGVVHLPSPLTYSHGSEDFLIATWFGCYAARTPGCEGGANTTWLMLEDVPQPDCFLRIRSEYGGQSGLEGGCCQGAPELIVEVCHSSKSYDLGPKLRLYRKAGVLEYITAVLAEDQIIWRRLAAGNYVSIEPGADGWLRSVVFPGLWLDPEALLRRDASRVLRVLNKGLRSLEHREFVKALKARR
jgi:Uma2 family endonuclease